MYFWECLSLADEIFPAVVVTVLQSHCDFHWQNVMCFLFCDSFSFVVWPAMSCFADWSKCRHVTLIIIEWSTCHGRLCVIIMINSHVTVTVPSVLMPSVLWRCWLGGRKGIRPVKNRVVGCWCGCLSGARCRLAYGPADATATHCLLLQ